MIPRPPHLRRILLAFAAAPLLAHAAADFQPLDRNAARSLTDPRNHGRPTAVALWSAECEHCKKNLTALAELARRHPQLRIVTVEAEPATADSAPLLARTGLTRDERYAYGDESPEALAHALDPRWRGELPRTYLFDGQGGSLTRSGVLTAADMRSALKLK